MEENNKKVTDIKVDLFAICEGAYNHSGHLTIVSTHDDFIVSAVPTRVSFGLAFKFFIKPDVEGTKKLTISIQDDQGADVIEPCISANLEIVKMNHPSHIAMAINLQNVLFTKFGQYDVHLEIDGVKLDNFAFEVRNGQN